jgi:hypothetical protein
VSSRLIGKRGEEEAWGGVAVVMGTARGVETKRRD